VIRHIIRMSCIVVMSSCTLLGQVGAATRTIELPPETAQLKPSTLPGYSIARGKCAICHSVDYILYQPPQMTQAQWTAEAQKMQRSYGAPLDADEIRLVGIYLATVYGDASSVSATNR
jgi:cytochrome c